MQTKLSLYFVAGSQDFRHLAGNPCEHFLNTLNQALQAGISCFQFRDKGQFSLATQPLQQKQLAIQCRDLCRQYQVPFIINDDVELAIEIDADGIHVGQTDTPIAQIKRKIDRPFILGLSINTLSQALASDNNPDIDYFGVGPIFPTQSKEDPKPVVGLNFIQQLRQAGIKKPIVAIGGIKHPQDCRHLRQTGANGVAVISALTQSPNIAQSVQQLLTN
ncbi:thiamine-phosphate diphosphorylase [Volucribacter psittacicida]|uniref:Thiamine-phosphate synthase n=1 Tax=Volucribacter psittacicida TaxID=203482 RepID=A0A4R1G2M9_9PAST|nr:thiamine phosphate synthase [Volucribacter psittacicida]TCK01994.1 thiamine-phosphate diphosphorylase [Volucribacter psittacicida]